MKKILIPLVVMTISLASFAIPARRVFHDYQQPDGSVLTLTLAGDEFAHWFEDAQGTMYRLNDDDTFEPVAATRSEQHARRMAAKQRRVKADVGTEPYPAPRGLLILANFSDVQFKAANDHDVMDSLINAVNCQVNNGYGSAAQYFRDQSDGQYQPVFDVYGPVNLSQKQSYYGQNLSNDEDKYATDAVIEACILANQQYPNLDFADYDWNNDGDVDFVYVIYAGKGEADGGASTTIWPHNYSIQMIIQYKGQGTYSTYSKADTKLDGKYLDNYAMSQELDGQTGKRTGNGVFCHEFGHVIGLPDFYDTSYGSNYEGQLTPNEWDVMDGGGYNGSGHCPPNYSAWEKYFMGWITPENLGSDGANLTLYASGTPEHNVYQINSSGKLEKATKDGLNYYIENRQKDGWDACLPAAGMLIWKVNFSSSLWTNNEPNLSERGKPHYTLIIPEGTKIGKSFAAENVWPYNTNNSWEGVSGKPLKEITKNGKLITLVYIDAIVDPFELKWMANGEEFATTTSQGKVVLPDNEPEPLSETQVFVGWCRTAKYRSETTAPVYVKNGDYAKEGDIFYAVYATQNEAGAVETNTYTFTSKDWKDATGSWTSSKDASTYSSRRYAVQVLTSASGAGAVSKEEFDQVSKIIITYCTNATTGVGSVTVKVGETEITKETTKDGGVTMRELEYTFDDLSGAISFEVNCTANSIYIKSITVTAAAGVSYRDYTTGDSGQSAVGNTTIDQVKAVKAIRNGQVVIIRGDEIYNLLGVKL